ncbi:hypothetical protein RRG08_037348 [Elysia crispata]|uniref:Uncharacterized protein n=1 Tax=Elysia crispata TaxID=231223 RepID=A0AAE1AB52_9GAST|nr:hypothetical protein RRG08_037348 [Elysia crispata]
MNVLHFDPGRFVDTDERIVEEAFSESKDGICVSTMKFSILLVAFLSVVAVESASMRRELCRTDWCAVNKIFKTMLNGKLQCCLDWMHQYLIVEFIHQRNGRVVEKCYCQFV